MCLATNAPTISFHFSSFKNKLHFDCIVAVASTTTTTISFSVNLFIYKKKCKIYDLPLVVMGERGKGALGTLIFSHKTKILLIKLIKISKKSEQR